MLKFMRGPVHGAIIALLLILNTLFWASLLYVAVLLKLVTPKSRLRNYWSRLASRFAQTWASVNVLMADLLIGVQWDIRMNAAIDHEGQYLVCSNHQSWNDIFVVMKAFDRRGPFFKFFLKQELIWVPVLGLAWWGLDYPFMKRYTREQIQKNPKLAGVDLATTRKACEAFRHEPALILNYLEGTRFTPAKHQRQASPYRHLLKPKSGGFAFTIAALGPQLDKLLDVTIVYPGGAVGFWQFLCGHMRRAIVEVREMKVPAEFYSGSYESDPAYRARFHTWIAALWAEKDRRIGELLAESGAAA